MTLSLDLLSSDATYTARRRWAGTRAYWLCQCVGWGGLLLLLASPLPFSHRTSGAEVVALVFFCVSGVGLSHLLRLALLAGFRHGHSRPALAARMIPALVAAPLLHAALQLTWARYLLPHRAVLMSTRPGEDPMLFSFADTLSLSVGLFLAWTGFYLGLRIYRQYQAARIERLELAAHVQEAAWQALRAQLNPHLLFNSLNSIRALIPPGERAPREALTHLSELLRSSLSLKQDERVPLRREMETVESFLALERLRFESRLRVSLTVSPDALDWQVPPFAVQILVENAVKFGVAPYEEGGDIGIHVDIEGGQLRIEVVNRGELGGPRRSSSTGLGLANLRSRLALLFGPAASVELGALPSGHVRARVRVPALTAKAQFRQQTSPA